MIFFIVKHEFLKYRSQSPEREEQAEFKVPLPSPPKKSKKSSKGMHYHDCSCGSTMQYRARLFETSDVVSLCFVKISNANI